MRPPCSDGLCPSAHCRSRHFFLFCERLLLTDPRRGHVGLPSGQKIRLDAKHRRDWTGDEAAVATQYEDRLEEFFRRLTRVALTGRDREIDAETADLLRRLGYVGGK